MALDMMPPQTPTALFKRATSSAGSSTIVIPRTPRGAATRARNQSLSTIAEDHDCLDLPPITHMKSAISRNKISDGVSYALPADKSRNAVEGQYRTNLRLMFKEPYVSEGKVFDDERLAACSRHHLQPNTVPSIIQPTNRATRSAEDWKLNMESEKCRLAYSYSAPSTGLTGRITGESDLRARSTLFLPLKARVPPEAIKLKEEAERIIQSVQERDQSTELDRAHGGDSKLQHDNHSLRLKRLSRHFSIYPDLKLHSEPSEWSNDEGEKKASSFGSYASLKAFKHPTKRPLPEELKNTRLSVEKCEMIWDWLWDYEVITDFTFFKEICK